MACHRQKGLWSTWHVSHVAERYAIFHVKSTAPQLHVRNVFIIRCCSKETWSLNLKLKSMTNVSQLALFPVLDFISNSKITFLGVESRVWIVQVFILSAWWLWQYHQECACPVWGPRSGAQVQWNHLLSSCSQLSFFPTPRYWNLRVWWKYLTPANDKGTLCHTPSVVPKQLQPGQRAGLNHHLQMLLSIHRACRKLRMTWL